MVIDRKKLRKEWRKKAKKYKLTPLEECVCDFVEEKMLDAYTMGCDWGYEIRKNEDKEDKALQKLGFGWLISKRKKLERQVAILEERYPESKKELKDGNEN